MLFQIITFNIPTFIRDALSNFDYVKIRTVKMVGLLLNVFCKRKHIPYLKEMEVSETRTGLLGLWVKYLFYYFLKVFTIFMYNF